MQPILTPMVWMFSGHGTHYHHMGKVLFDCNATFKHTILQGEKFLQNYCNISILDYLYNENNIEENVFQQSQKADPCIVLIEVAIARMLFAEGFRPHFLLSVNIGDISAAIISNTIPFATGLILALEQSKGRKLTNKLNLFNNYNKTLEEFNKPHPKKQAHKSQKHTLQELIRDLIELYNMLKSHHLICHILPISHQKDLEIPTSFSTKFELQNEQEDNILNKIRNINLSYNNISPELFWETLKYPLKFVKAIHFFESIGTWTYVDCGPNELLSTYVKHNLKPNSKSQFFPILSPNGNVIRNLEKLKEYIITSKL